MAQQSRVGRTRPRQAAASRCAPAHLPHTNGPAGRSWPQPAPKSPPASIRDQLLTSHERGGAQPCTVPPRHVEKKKNQGLLPAREHKGKTAPLSGRGCPWCLAEREISPKYPAPSQPRPQCNWLLARRSPRGHCCYRGEANGVGRGRGKSRAFVNEDSHKWHQFTTQAACDRACGGELGLEPRRAASSRHGAPPSPGRGAGGTALAPAQRRISKSPFKGAGSAGSPGTLPASPATCLPDKAQEGCGQGEREGRVGSEMRGCHQELRGAWGALPLPTCSVQPQLPASSGDGAQLPPSKQPGHLAAKLPGREVSSALCFPAQPGR